MTEKTAAKKNGNPDTPTRKPHASGPEREQALMGILSTLLQVVRSLAENQPSLGLSQHATAMQQHYEVLDPPMETPQDREEREAQEKDAKAHAKTHAHA